MANRKDRKKHPPLKYHDEPTPEAFWRWILKGDPSGLIRPKPKAFPPFVKMGPYQAELLHLVTRMAREQELYRDAGRLLMIRQDLEKSPQASERDLAAWTGTKRDKVHRLLEVKRLYDRLMNYLEQTRPHRVRAARPSRATGKRTAVRITP